MTVAGGKLLSARSFPSNVRASASRRVGSLPIRIFRILPYRWKYYKHIILFLGKYPLRGLEKNEEIFPSILSKFSISFDAGYVTFIIKSAVNDRFVKKLGVNSPVFAIRPLIKFPLIKHWIQISNQL